MTFVDHNNVTSAIVDVNIASLI